MEYREFGIIVLYTGLCYFIMEGMCCVVLYDTFVKQDVSNRSSLVENEQ